MYSPPRYVNLNHFMFDSRHKNNAPQEQSKPPDYTAHWVSANGNHNSDLGDCYPREFFMFLHGTLQPLIGRQ